MSDIVYKTTFTEAEIAEKKAAYLAAKQALMSSLREAADMLEKAGEAPLAQEERRLFMAKFGSIDHRLLDKLDLASFAYFEATENPQS